MALIFYEVESEKAFTSKIGELVWMMNHVRSVTVEEVRYLTVEALDQREDGGNSIGALLLHTAAIEYVHQVISFEHRDLNEKEAEQWGAALTLGEDAAEAIHSRPASFYIKQLEDVRSGTLERLKEKGDEWLFEQRTWPNGLVHNPYYLWFHVMEDEINHRGQIRALVRKSKSMN
ncbi:DUF664 domain-containing protein [Halobacillus litoralis]|uniref:DUF664 domain-containing protein n=1 Tax=Halobacillus litoralis TaxID=45668 RepID=A0A845DRK8_9BACI|nr:DinB family protein [Halobacillus litoralis]MYL19499.1 DUF664 domain-containing protein [Halobacillus litoralis]MYL37924.1 DUF664 domain-containing protein [Halobacillus litoralis]